MGSNRHAPGSRTLVDYVGLLASGFAMGASNMVPGVSGGTMALILGIYEELIDSIRGVVNPEAIKLLLRFKVKQALALLPWKFLLSVAVGMLAAVLTLAHFLDWMLREHAVLLWSFFFGLVAASILTVGKRIQKWGAKPIVGAAIGAITLFVIVGLVPLETPNAPWFLFLSGAVAICTMVLPGISGAFILVLLGKYQFALSAVTNRDYLTLVLIAAGAAVGIVTFTQVLSRLLKRYPDTTVGVLAGMMLGSLRKIWPWKETLSLVANSQGEMVPLKQVNVLPAAWTLETTLALVLAMLGFAIVFVLTSLASRRGRREG